MKKGNIIGGINFRKDELLYGNVCINLRDIKRECNTNNQSCCAVCGENHTGRSAINTGNNPHSLLTIREELFAPAGSEEVLDPLSKAGSFRSIENQFRDALSTTHYSPPPYITTNFSR